MHASICLLLVTAVPCQAEPQETTKPDEASKYSARGSFDFKYLGRWTAGARDHDLFMYGSIDIGDPRTHFATAHASGRVAWDLDRNRDPAHPFRSVDDSRSGDVTGRVYSAYVDLNGVESTAMKGMLKRVRIGRQIMYDTPRTLFLDGMSLHTPPATEWMDLDVIAYGGVPSHLFESSASGDSAAGAAIRFGPWTGGRFRLDYMHVTDEYLASNADDDLFGVRWDQRIGQRLFLNAHVNMIDFEDSGDVGAFASWTDPESDFNVTLRYTGLLGDDKRRSIDLDYFTEVLATYVSFDQYDVALHKGLGESVYFAAGAQVRELRNDAKESLFNHEFHRYHGTAGLTEWPWTGLDASATYEYWDAGGDRFTTVGADLTQKSDGRWSGSIGTFFELFRYDVLRGQENEDVQVSYLKLAYNFSEQQRLRLRLEFEDGETDDFYTLGLSMRVEF